MKPEGAGRPVAPKLDKAALRDSLVERLQADLDALTASQRETQAGATHEESRPENDKDTRALESTYLARGLAQRVEALRGAVSAVTAMSLRAFTDDAPIALSALVEVEDEDGRAERYFLAPAGGGTRVPIDHLQVAVVTPDSPLGRALLGKQVDDEVELRTSQGRRRLAITGVT